MATMELFHCKHCGQDKPADEMRRDKSYKSGFRPQCLDCKRRMEGSTAKKTVDKIKTVHKQTAPKNTAPPTKAASPQAPKPKPKPAPKLPPEERLYRCNRCEREDVPWVEMTKDRRKFMGVGSWCLQCRREREEELRSEKKTEELRQEKQKEVVNANKKATLADVWEHCFKCNAKARPGILRQPPPLVANGFPDGALLCGNCMNRAGDRTDIVRAERARMGIPEDASRKQLESAARVAALRELAQTHADEYRKIFQRYMMALGVESEKKWISL